MAMDLIPGPNLLVPTVPVTDASNKPASTLFVSLAIPAFISTSIASGAIGSAIASAVASAVSGLEATPTGTVRLTIQSTAASGWLMCNDGTIGSSGSGANYTAANGQNLYLLLWNNVSNTWAPVSSGRGASASADYSANKTISLTKMLGRALGVGGAGSGLTSRALGETAGLESLTLTTTQLPANIRTSVLIDVTITPTSINDGQTGGGTSLITALSTSIATASVGGGGASHSTMGPISFLNAEIKL